MSDTSARWTLRDLPFAARLTLAAFLISVGVGYLSALVNLHFAEASPGEMLPTPDDVEHSYRGKKGTSQWERLLVAHPNLPFNGQGSMRAALTKSKVGGWQGLVSRKAKELKLERENPEHRKRIETAVQADLDGERLALIAWAREEDGSRKKAYEEDAYPQPAMLSNRLITKKFLDDEDTKLIKIKSIIDSRCVRCHSESVNGPGANYPLETYEDVAQYFNVEPTSGKSLDKLALTTHVHLLGFSILYGITGVLFALTSLPAIIRLPIAPLALVAQVVDISFWWLARMDDPHGPMFAQAIRFSGMVVAGALGVQIVGTLFSLFGRLGKVVVLALVIAGGAAGYHAKTEYLDPYLAMEKTAAQVENE